MIGVATAAVAVLLAPLAVGAQPPGKIPRVGVLSPQNSTESPTIQRQPFEQGLRELGWTPGTNLAIEYRYAEGKSERLPELAAELVRQKVDVIVARGPAIPAARQATSTIPIVMSAHPDPVGQRLVESLARPGGNVTGLSWLAGGSLAGKQLELLKETIPGLARVAVLGNPRGTVSLDGPAIDAAARPLGLEVKVFTVDRPSDIAEAFAAIGRARVGALLVFAEALVLEPNRAQVVALAAKHRLPAMYPWRLYVDSGGLMSYATSIPEFHRRAAAYVDKILKGAKPGDLPVEQPTKFELTINLKTARALGLTIPPLILARADDLIQ